MKNQFKIRFFILSLSSLFCFPLNLWAQTPKTIAILPFEIIAAKDLSYIQSGAFQMLHSRLLWKDHITIIDKNQMQSHLDTASSKDSDTIIKKIADATGCDFVLAGSITSFADAFSIDSKIYDIKNKQYLSFSEQSKTLDDVIPKINLIAAKINKKVFQRQTAVYENLVKEEKEKIEQMRRQNPENLMPVFPQGEQEEKTPIWKIWKYL
ncbi:MAG: hypothetical protein KKE62_14745 [Proteobacteria bacterium]|nr:hypothetical protein [Pseudomonadota bacterium]MBU1389268.1 hypothetical protein [Pseudomonadota bacterium]MBU1544088.1 hypothetical protein [Pseudomonadota bacterium]MBU2480623.1 hypothetical protein [Pseudomonadota bacterium]